MGGQSFTIYAVVHCVPLSIFNSNPDITGVLLNSSNFCALLGVDCFLRKQHLSCFSSVSEKEIGSSLG